ncbi:hypothetical protein [Nocardia jiangsuensis]|uniref:Uncharacterized protein n=1 Tax=Nocardia jiangsuensis TaxID=1691563 RepID=A0ABV8DX87_9NOCA
MPSCDTIAAAWLARTELAADRSAVALLSRAIDPPESAPERDPLPITAAAEPATAAAILELLEHGEVPTLAAVRTHIAHRELRGEAERTARLGELAQCGIDDFGRILARLTHDHWIRHGTGPTRRDVLDAPAVHTAVREHVGDVAPTAVRHLWLLERAQRAGWIAYNTSPRSLCAGRRFHAAKYGQRVSLQPVETIGTLVARFADDYRTRYDRSPRWNTLAHDLRDNRGRRVFFDTADAHVQRLWLVTAGWLATPNDLPAPGPLARRLLAAR